MSVSLQGQLSDGVLTNLLQYLALNQANGCLLLRHPKGAMGRVFFESGKVVHIATENDEDVMALSRLLGWTQGRFNFLSGSDIPKRTIKFTLESLLLEASYQADVSSPSGIEDITPDTIFKAKEINPHSTTVKITLRALQIMRYLDGKTPLSTVANSSNVSFEEAVQVVKDLMTQDLVELAGAPVVDARLVPELMTIMNDIMGPMGSIVVEDALYDLGLDANSLSENVVSELLNELNKQLRNPEWQQSFRQRATQLVQALGIQG